MPDEASVTIVARMRDEASAKMKVLNQNVETNMFSMQQFQSTLTATGGALTAVGSLMGQLGGEAGKNAAIFITMAGAIMSTIGAITAAIPMIKSLTASITSLNIAKAIGAALAGPMGWGTLAIGLGLAGIATGAIIAMSRTPRTQAAPVQVVNFNSQAFSGSQADARKFSRQMQTIAREETRLGR